MKMGKKIKQTIHRGDLSPLRVHLINVENYKIPEYLNVHQDCFLHVNFCNGLVSLATSNIWKFTLNRLQNFIFRAVFLIHFGFTL